MWLGSGDQVEQRAGNARLADAGLAHQQQALAIAARRLRPALAQHRQLLVAADHRAEVLAGPRLEAAAARLLAIDREDRERRVQPLDRPWPQWREIEGGLHLALRCLGDDDLSRPRQLLQAGRDVGRVAGHRRFLGRALAHQVAHYDEPGGNAGARGERHAVTGAQFRTAATAAMAARTDRSAPSSCALGQPK